VNIDQKSQGVDVQNAPQEVNQMKSLLAVALSGGVDSLVSAALLKEAGHQLVGLHFLTGYEGGTPARGDSTPHAVRDDMAHLSRQLGIPVHIIDLRSEFQDRVVDYFVQTYASGKTPNPCLVCNPLIKFDILYSRAKELGALRLATGHYARIEKAPDGRMKLLRGRDRKKEQSYFLSRLTQEQLASAVLPLGNLTKAETRRIARERGLVPITYRESQDVCFIKDLNYADFLSHQPGFSFSPGPIENTNGQTIGRHNGLHRFTIGQRRGINCPAAYPYYVVRIDPERNGLIVGTRDELCRRGCLVDRINWIAAPPVAPLEILIRVRYRHQAVPATLTPLGDTRAEITFYAPESAVTPGQGAVFYHGEEVLGGGWIE
jgi:tRNA-specific 2-thiouridylase